MGQQHESDLIMVHVAEPRYGAQVGVQVLRTHAADKCAGQFCCIHNPSDHHMATWPQNWRGDRGIMERICPCGVGHPDPDGITYIRATRGAEVAWGESVHGCCGCCRKPEPEEGQAGIM